MKKDNERRANPAYQSLDASTKKINLKYDFKSTPESKIAKQFQSSENIAAGVTARSIANTK